VQSKKHRWAKIKINFIVIFFDKKCNENMKILCNIFILFCFFPSFPTSGQVTGKNWAFSRTRGAGKRQNFCSRAAPPFGCVSAG
jgi:hypothetical protein